MNRKNEVLEYLESKIDNTIILIPLVEQMVFLEEQLFELKKLPMVKVHPRNKQIVKPTETSKLYKDFLQQYNHVVKNISSMLNKKEQKEESPLRKYFKEFVNK